MEIFSDALLTFLLMIYNWKGGKGEASHRVYVIKKMKRISEERIEG